MPASAINTATATVVFTDRLRKSIQRNVLTLSPLYRPVPPALGSPFLRPKSPS